MNSYKNFWSGRPTFITGGTGFLGQWLVRKLVTQGAHLILLLRDGGLAASGVRDLLSKLVLVHGNVENYRLLERALNEYEVDTVFHLAAQSLVGVANRSPLSTFETNIRGTWNLLEAARCVGTVKRVVIASSDKAYGPQVNLPYTEDMPLLGRYPYDVSKSCADMLAQSYFWTYDLPVCITRCANLYGGGDLNFSRLIPGTIRSALLGERPIIRSDGKFVRDYLYVQDAVRGCLMLAEQMASGSIAGEAFNLSTEEPASVLDVTNLILDLAGRGDLEPHILNEAKAEIIAQSLSAQKIREKVGWVAEYNLRKGLGETLAWYRKYLAL